MADNNWRKRNIGRLMNEAVRVFEKRVIDLMHEKGFGDLGAAHINLTRHLDEDGNRLTELAERAVMTKQSMGELVEQVERAGLVERRPDPSDRRAKLIVFTPAGLEWLDAFGDSIRTAEAEAREAMGSETADAMANALTLYVERSGA